MRQYRRCPARPTSRARWRLSSRSTASLSSRVLSTSTRKTTRPRRGMELLGGHAARLVLGRSQAAILQKRPDLRRPAVELLEELSRLHRAAARQDLGAEKVAVRPADAAVRM